MLNVYFDNDVASAISRRDCKEETALQAIDEILEVHRSGKLALRTLRQSARRNRGRCV